MASEQDKSAAYQRGRCRDCNASIPPLGDSCRCSECDEKFSNYVDSMWGLADVIEERNRLKALGICYSCGNMLAVDDNYLCQECERPTNLRSAKQIADTNPYLSVWDKFDDNAGYLTPGYQDMANRMRQKAQFCETMSQRGGPKGRDYASDAAIYNRIANNFEQKATDARRMR